jgi:hypothetical protein
MKLPAFTADSALSPSLVHYRTGNHCGAITVSSVEPAIDGCWCSEPDTRTVCNRRGSCYEKWVCLQWFCPNKGGEIDAEELPGAVVVRP